MMTALPAEAEVRLGDRDPGAAVGARPPRFGDIVSCYFPENEAPRRPGIKPRPCLVLKAALSASGLWHVRLAYGTGQRPEAERAGEMTLSDPASLAAAGLHRPTRFVLSHARTVPFIFRYFRANRAGAAILGSLSPDDLKRAKQALAAARPRERHEASLAFGR